MREPIWAVHPENQKEAETLFGMKIKTNRYLLPHQVVISTSNAMAVVDLKKMMIGFRGAFGNPEFFKLDTTNHQILRTQEGET